MIKSRISASAQPPEMGVQRLWLRVPGTLLFDTVALLQSRHSIPAY
jgi:hypothetical protein